MSLLSLQNISKTLQGNSILENISFSVEKGEIFGFVGPNGAGKTTTLKVILGIIDPTKGNISIFGKSPTAIEVKKRIGFMPENTYIYKYLTGDEFLDFCGAFYHMDQKKLQKRKDFVLAKVGLMQDRNKRLSFYSKGMLQRIGIAQAILHNPEIIFLDEPMSGLDPIGRKMIKDILIEMKNEGKTIFFNSHILSDVEVLCDHCAIIAKGKIVAHLDIKKLSKPLEEIFIEKVGN